MPETDQPTTTEPTEPATPEPSRTWAIIGLVVALVIIGVLIALKQLYNQPAPAVSPPTTTTTTSQADPALSADQVAADQQLIAADKELNAADQGLNDQPGDLSE